MMHNKIAVTLLCIAVNVGISTGFAWAHSPLFPDGNHAISTAYDVKDADKSWVAYASTERPDGVDYYQFTRKRGQKIEFTFFSARSPRTTGFQPSFALLIPDIDRRDSLPDFVEIPKNYGSVLVRGADPGKATYEPFVQGVFYTISEFSLNAPTDGTYYVAVFSSTKGAGNYGLTIGYLEGWTPAELALLSFNSLRIYGWEGQNRFLILLPLMLTLILGGVLLRRRSRLGRAPRNRAQWFSAFSGLFFIGTALDAIAKMLWSFTVARVTEEALITLLIAAVPTILGTLALRYAMRGSTSMTFWSRLLLIGVGIIGLFSWCGLYFGPAMAVAAGFCSAPDETSGVNGKTN